MNEEWDWLDFIIFVSILGIAVQVMRHVMGV
jgi:hypothetical protein